MVCFAKKRISKTCEGFHLHHQIENIYVHEFKRMRSARSPMLSNPDCLQKYLTLQVRIVLIQHGLHSLGGVQPGGITRSESWCLPCNSPSFNTPIITCVLTIMENCFFFTCWCCSVTRLHSLSMEIIQLPLSVTTFTLDLSPPRYSFIIHSFDIICDLASWNDCMPVENLAKLVLGQSNSRISTCCSSSLVMTPWVEHQGHCLYEWPRWLCLCSPVRCLLLWSGLGLHTLWSHLFEDLAWTTYLVLITISEMSVTVLSSGALQSG